MRFQQRQVRKLRHAVADRVGVGFRRHQVPCDRAHRIPIIGAGTLRLSLVIEAYQGDLLRLGQERIDTL